MEEGVSEVARLRPGRILHTMLRVTDLDRSIAFYVERLGMTLFRREYYPDGRFTLAFLGYGQEASGSVIELTHNWESSAYEMGTAFGHVALEVDEAAPICQRLRAEGVKVLRRPGPMSFVSPDRGEPEVIAFIEDPDGYRIELIERAGARERRQIRGDSCSR
jgi:lactoylglutathione lyase